MVPWVLKSKGQPDQTYQRYYHLYAKGELEEDVISAGGAVVESGYEKDNWWVIARRQ
jgi:tRNA (uracil-5-)-methyltransferase TRM9